MSFLRTVMLVTLLVPILTSCFKDGEPLPTQCKVSGAAYYNNGLLEDSSSYQYTGNKITTLKLGTGTFRFDYDSIYIIRKSLFTSDPAHADQYDTIQYNTNKTIKQILSYINLGSA